ncbi:MAG: hypothetical protein ACOCU4_09020, partial [Alkalispirochaeta sp.]
MRAPVRSHSHLVLVVLVAFFNVSGERISAQEEPFVVPIDVIVTDGRITEQYVVTARIQPDGTLESLAAAEFGPTVQPLTQPDILSELFENEWLSLKMLTAAGLDATYSPADLTAQISIPAALQPIREISGTGGRSRNAEETVSPAHVSVALPFQLTGQHVTVAESEDAPGEVRQRLGVELLPSITYAGTVFSGTINAQHGADEQAIQSWQAAVSRDLFSTTRITAGTTRIDSFGFQTGQPVFGAGIEKRAGLAGTPVLADRFQAFFDLETSGTVEIYLNERLIRTERLPAGRYSLSDVPLVPGLNDVRIVVTDELGTTREIVDRIAHASNLLARGADEYGLAIG